MKTPLVLLAALCLTGCSTTATLTPVSGPLAGTKPIQAKIEGIAGHNGRLSFTMPNGGFVEGEWTTVNSKLSATKGAATAHGNRGSVFDIEFECDSFARGIGKASDNKGNTYRVIVKGI